MDEINGETDSDRSLWGERQECAGIMIPLCIAIRVRLIMYIKAKRKHWFICLSVWLTLCPSE